MTNRRRLSHAAIVTIGILLAATVAVPQGAQAQQADSVLARIGRMAGTGDRAAARVLADSLLTALPDASPLYPEALYWRAFSSSNAADAERDYLKLSIEYPLSARAPGALLALAQLEYARGDRAAARRRFDRLLREYPSGRHLGHASYWSARLAFEDGDRSAACAAFAVARRAAAADDVELVNQIDYYAAQCAVAPVAPPVSDTTPPPVDTLGVAGASSSAAAKAYSVQVAAFNSRRDAADMVARLKQRGFDVRMTGSRAPYRVRIGRYDTREDATAALQRIRRSRLNGIIVEAEPR